MLDFFDSERESLIKNTVTYVLKLRDKKGFIWYYIGKTKTFFKRMENHISSGGDFVAANKNELVVEEIVEVRTGNKEKEVYREYRDNDNGVPEERVCGGR